MSSGYDSWQMTQESGFKGWNPVALTALTLGISFLGVEVIGALILVILAPFS